MRHAAIGMVTLALTLAGTAEAKRPRKGSKSAPAAVEAEAAAETPLMLPALAPPAATPAPRTGSGRRGAAPAPGGGGGAREVVQRESHIEFDERLVQGQTAAGAIYLFQRGESEFRSMVRLPDSFRDRTVRPLLPPPPTPTAQRQ